MHLRERVAALRVAGERLTTTPAALLRGAPPGRQCPVGIEAAHDLPLPAYPARYARRGERPGPERPRVGAGRRDQRHRQRPPETRRRQTRRPGSGRSRALETYRFAIESVRRRRKYTLPAEQEGIVSRLAPHRPRLADGALPPTHRPNRLRHASRPHRGTARVARPWSDRRSAGHRAPCRGHSPAVGGIPASIAICTPMALMGAVRSKNGLARVRGYRDAPDEAYQRAYLSTRGCARCWTACVPPPRCTRPSSASAFRSAREPRPAPPPGGARHSSSLWARRSRSFDRRSHRSGTRSMPGNWRRSSTRPVVVWISPAGRTEPGVVGPNGYPGIPSAIYLETFGQSYADVSRLAHESGHAVEEPAGPSPRRACRVCAGSVVPERGVRPLHRTRGRERTLREGPESTPQAILPGAVPEQGDGGVSRGPGRRSGAIHLRRGRRSRRGPSVRTPSTV
mgnify:CR=1 FL=1